MGIGSWWRRKHSGRRRDDRESSVPDLAVGQVWRYRTRPGEEDSRVAVLVIEQHPDLGEIVHARVDGVRPSGTAGPGESSTVLEHVQIEGAAFRRSVTDLVATEPVDPDPDRRTPGGRVHAMPIAEAVRAVEAALAGRTDTTWIDDNVRLAIDSLSSHAGFPLALDHRSLSWMEGFLERQRAAPGFDATRLVPVVGSFLGQCLVEHGPGQWRDDADGWFVRLPGVDARPFAKVDKQARYGLEGGESIVGFFEFVLLKNSEYDDTPSAERHEP